MTEIQCPTCGRPNVDDHNFCDHCGAPLFSLDPLPPDSPSLRDDFFDDPAGEPAVQPPESLDEASRLDSLLSPDEPLFSELQDQPPPASPEDDSSRLDDLIPAPEPGEEVPNIKDTTQAEMADEFSRLDDFFTEDDPSASSGARTGLSAPPPFDPFQEPSTRDALLGEEIRGDQPDDARDLFTRPEREGSLAGESPPSQIPDDNLDFLNSLRDDEEPGGIAPAPADRGEWDFLSGPSDDEEPTREGQPASSPGDEWDFLTSPSAEQEPPRDDQPSSSPGDEWDFLSAPSEEQALPSTDPPAPDRADGWDFLNATSAEEPAQAEPSHQEPTTAEDFLASLDRQESSSAAPQPGAEPDAEWGFLTPDPGSEPEPFGFRPDVDDEDEPLPEFGSPGFSEDSGWLDMLQDPATREAAAQEAALEKPLKPQTDWLDKIKRLNKSSEIVDQDSSFPDWLSVSEKPAEETPEPVKPSEPVPADRDQAASSTDLPAWLQIDDDESLSEFLRKKDLTNEEYKPAIVRGITDKLPPQEDDEEPATGLSDSQQIKFPSWAEEKSIPEKTPENLEFLKGFDDETGSVIDPFQIEEEDIFDDLFDEELPSWLTSASTGSGFEDIEEELSQGELPGWVEAMRPVIESTDATGLSEDEDYIENYGPLAGIPSVLPAEADVAFDPEKSAKKPLDLFATKSHQEYVNVLKKLISEENKTKTILKPAPVATQRVLRWLIAIIMLVTTTATIIFGGPIVADPPTSVQVQDSGYGALFDQIESLYAGQPVLIAYDYQPASAGELHTAAAGVVDHLMKQGTYLSLISTQPTGPALAENFLATTQEQHGYIHTQQYINLGYLPGESAGLLSFIVAPKQIIPLAFDGSNAWGSPPLKRVDTINDFAMILVITDDPDTAKIWIEQVGTILDDTPLTMVVSALAEPLIQPYYRSSPQLLKGYVAGIIDSMNYELLLDRPNRATEAWLPFNLAIIITVGTIFIGGLANGVMSLFSRHRSRAVGEVK